MSDNVILVDKKDQAIGTEEKLRTHQEGRLHRAFSIFVFNSSNELLLQKRVGSKYHSGGLWSNTCCGHPMPDEDTLTAAHRRLKEEMGFGCELKEIFNFTYKVNFPNGLTENEFDHVIVGQSDGTPNVNQNEASEFKWIPLDQLKGEIQKNPEDYTYWLKISLPKLIHSVNSSFLAKKSL